MFIFLLKSCIFVSGNSDADSLLFSEEYCEKL